MTRSEFFLAVLEEFGETQGSTLVRDLALDGLDDRSAQQALEEGVAPKTIWAALCAAMQVPLSRQHGAGTRAPLGDTPL